MNTHRQQLQEADACHDDDPSRAAELLQRIDPAALDAGERSLLAFLLNHVLGEKRNDWARANALQHDLLAACGDSAAPVLWRQAAAAASLAGDGRATAQASRRLAEAVGVDSVMAAEMVQLAALGFELPRADAQTAAARVNAAMHALQGAPWQTGCPFDGPAAATCNNIASELGARPVAELRSTALRAALIAAAEHSRRLWQRCGDWVNHERACYGVAVAANAAADAGKASSAASHGLALLDEHDHANDQTVDRAFLELERAFAFESLGRTEDAAAARRRSAALADAFADDALKSWYAQRVSRHDALRAG